MKFGVMLPAGGRAAADPAFVVGVARAAEEAGFESIWAFEHAVVPADYESSYPYSRDGKMGIETADFPDPLAVLAFVGAATDHIRLGTGVLILPQRNPVIGAKEVASIDALTGGRMLLGVGVGWLREEAEAVGIGWEDRGRRTDEHIEAMRRLWTDDVASYQGEFVSFDGVMSRPKPAQAGGVPVIVGGHSPAAARRAGRLGDGWYPVGLRPDALAEQREMMRRSAEAVGRDPDRVELTCSGGHRAKTVQRFADLGADRWVVPLTETELGAATAKLAEVGETLIAEF